MRGDGYGDEENHDELNEESFAADGGAMTEFQARNLSGIKVDFN